MLATVHLVPALGPRFVQANLKGRDLLKTYDTPIPESLGLVCASIYILLLILFIPFAFSDVFINFHEQSLQRPREGLIVMEFPHQKVSKERVL
ncbi:hypothetical protein NLI96_g11026 [Meripilus lineatus]|uniref:Uncharacterized protein n=1 Tax=Meripilus lineatus TaxID=2056292 RepID=A0AAD5USI8_9APHY|nr:hypothetical protein NLI96_g11026 [Physisporinus lineatus]